MQADVAIVHRPIRPATLLLLATAAVLVIVAGLVVATIDWSSRPDTLRIGGADAGTTVDLRPGQSLEITLAANPTTGFDWVVTSIDETVLRPVGEPVYESDSELVGAGGTVTFRFEGAGRGDSVLSLGYLRAWEDAEPIDTFEALVSVR